MIWWDHALVGVTARNVGRGERKGRNEEETSWQRESIKRSWNLTGKKYVNDFFILN